MIYGTVNSYSSHPAFEGAAKSVLCEFCKNDNKGIVQYLFSYLYIIFIPSYYPKYHIHILFIQSLLCLSVTCNTAFYQP